MSLLWIDTDKGDGVDHIADISLVVRDQKAMKKMFIMQLNSSAECRVWKV